MEEKIYEEENGSYATITDEGNLYCCGEGYAGYIEDHVWLISRESVKIFENVKSVSLGYETGFKLKVTVGDRKVTVAEAR